MIQQDLSVKKRDGRVVAFDAANISQAITNAFRAEGGSAGRAEPDRDLEAEVERTTSAVVSRLPKDNGGIEVETIQDLVEEQLMRDGYYRVARRYIIYREEHKKARMFRGESGPNNQSTIKVRHEDGRKEALEVWKLRQSTERACRDLEGPEPQRIVDETLGSLYNGITAQQVRSAMVLAV